VFQTRKLVREIKPDILDAQNITIHGYLAVAAGFHPLAVYAWGSDILVDMKNPLLRILSRYVLKKADYVYCTSEQIVERVVNLGIPADKVEMTVIGVDTEKFSPNVRDPETCSPQTVISVRNLKAVYDVETLIEAIPMVLQEFPQTRFIIAGEGEQSSYLGTLAWGLDVLNSIIFTGLVPRDELPKYLASSYIYVSTSLSDGTSQALLEAMACGLAPIVTDIPANRPWVTDGINGFLFLTKAPATLAARIIRLLENSGMRKEFGRASRQIIQERAEYSKSMAKVEARYKELIEEVKHE